MVSANLYGIASEYDDMVSDRDFMGFVALAGVGALGGVVAEMWHDRVAPYLNQPTEPSNATGLVGSFGIKAAASILLMYLAMRMEGTAMLVLAVLGLGATMDAGVDLLEAVDALRNTSTAASPARQPRQVRRAVPQQSQPRAVQSAPSNAASNGRSGGLLSRSA